MKLSENTVLITGGGSGIGLALAKEFSLRKSSVVVCGRDTKKLAAVQKENPGIATFPCNIASETDQESLLERMMSEYPSFNILINNAGIQHNYDFSETDNHLDLIEEEVNINFMAQLKLTDRCLPILKTKPHAAIINVSSALALVPKKSAPIYCATKAAMHSFTKGLRYQLEDTQIKVFEIIPALVETAMTEGRGKGKITPEALASEALRGIESDQYEIRIGKTKLLFMLNRIFPSIADKIIKNG